MAFATPLRYPGGKGRLGAWLAEVLYANDLNQGTYVEPYAGGAGAAIFLLTQGYVSRIIINDIDPAIHAFWWSILNDTNRFLDKLQRCTVSLAARERHRRILASPSQHSMTDLGFATFFLNRTSRSGILKGGVIGGKGQDGEYKLDARFNRATLSSRIETIASARDRIELHGVDAMQLVSKIRRRLTSKSLVYFDPPYYWKGAQLYRNHYSAKDHATIAGQVKTLRTPWLVTYDDCTEIRALYRGSNEAKFSLYYSTHLSRDHKKEVMFYDNIDLPEAPFLRR